MRTLITILLLSMSLWGRTYHTTFSVSENPLSESGNWLNGGVCTGCGADWANIKTTGGYAQSTQTSGATGFDDATAVVNGSWGNDQTVTITGKNPSSQGGTQEIEIRLRTTITPHSITGYEVDFIGGGAVDIVRWNGPLNDFTHITTFTYDWTSHTNPILKASIIGTTITVYECTSGPCNSLGSTTDSTYSTGDPGIGIDQTITSASTDFGITDFLADDGVSGTTCGPTQGAKISNGALIKCF